MTDHLHTRLHRARVLLIEDSVQIQRFVARTLAPYDVEIDCLADGLDGFDHAIQLLPDAILLDLGLPNIDGSEILSMLRSSPRTASIPVLILTGRADPVVHARALANGADDFVTKPVDARVLLARIANLVARARAERSNRQLLQQLRRYVSQPARQEGIQARSIERLEAAILVTDLRDFTATSLSTDPDAMFEAISTVLASQAEIIRQFGGYIDKFSGDGLLAVFGDTSGVVQACSAAGALLQWALTTDVVPLWQPVPIGLGLHTGSVLRGELGSADRRDHTVLGPVVNIAARLCAVAGPVEAIISEDAFQQVQTAPPEQVRFGGIEQLQLKGLPGPLSARRLLV